MTRTNLIANLIDLFGYSEDDFEDMTIEDIMNYLTDNQKVELKKYES